jgi:hypothetical protein
MNDSVGTTLNGSRPSPKPTSYHRLVIILIFTSIQWTNRIQTFIVYTGTEDEQSIAGSVLDLCVRHADLLDRASNSASSFGSPESRIGSPVESIDAWDTQI